MFGFNWVWIFTAVAALYLLSYQLASVQKQVTGLSRFEAKLDLLLKQAGIEYDPYKNVPPQVTESLQRGDKLQAIKYYREATNVGLKEAKDFIEEIQRRTTGGA